MAATSPYNEGMDPENKVFGGRVGTLAAGDSIVIPAAGMSALTVISGAGATTTVNRVDSLAGTPSGNSEDVLATVAAHTATASPVDWPFYHIAAAGGSARYALV